MQQGTQPISGLVPVYAQERLEPTMHAMMSKLLEMTCSVLSSCKLPTGAQAHRATSPPARQLHLKAAEETGKL